MDTIELAKEVVGHGLFVVGWHRQEQGFYDLTIKPAADGLLWTLLSHEDESVLSGTAINVDGVATAVVAVVWDADRDDLNEKRLELARKIAGKPKPIDPVGGWYE